MANAAPADPNTMVKLPAVVHGISGRYASCLWLAAYKKNVLTQVEQDVAKVQRSFVSLMKRWLKSERCSTCLFSAKSQALDCCVYSLLHVSQ